MKDRSQIKVCEKSRRIGISWADAGDSALEAARSDGQDTWYVGYNRDMTEQYIKDAARWSQALGLACSEVEESVIDDEGRDILTFRIKYASGYSVVALASRPSNLRSKQGRVRIDEAAFHDDLDELMKAAIALLMWGGDVAVWSTHNGINNPFNKLIKDIHDGTYDYSHHRYTFNDAVSDGLYKRICLIKKEVWTPEKELLWISQIRSLYGLNANEELDCVPSQAGLGSIFERNWFKGAKEYPAVGTTVRFWDLAATAKEVASKEHFYTAGVKMNRTRDSYTALDAIAEQVGPGDVEQLIISTASTDGRSVWVRWELEGGSAGTLWSENLKKRLIKLGYNADYVKPVRDKATQAMPLATEAHNGNVYVWPGPWTDQWLSALHRFDGTSVPLVTDLTDASSGAFNVLSEKGQQTARQSKQKKGNISHMRDLF